MSDTAEHVYILEFYLEYSGEWLNVGQTRNQAWALRARNKFEYQDGVVARVVLGPPGEGRVWG